MVKFIMGLIVVVAAVVGGYYYLSVKDAQAVVEEQTGAQLEARVNTNKIPPGAVMEDGTIPE